MTSTSSLPHGAWRRSTYSSNNGGNCLEVAADFSAFTRRAVPVRDSKVPDGPALLFPAGAWHTFVAGVREGLL